jgi:hypothetical protein
VLSQLPGYVEVSPSGLGLKCFAAATRWLELNCSGETVTVASKPPLYFAVTGNAYREGDAEADATKALATLEQVLDGAPTEAAAGKRNTVGPLPDQVVPGRQETAMFKHACQLRRLGMEEPEITAALWAEVKNGRFPNEAGREPWTLEDCRREATSACRFPKGDGGDFVRNPQTGKIAASNPDNVSKALRALGVRPRRDRFSEKVILEWEDGRGTRDLSDEEARHVWFSLHEAFNYQPAESLLAKVLDREADLDSFHPVLDYLAGLNWDETPRVGSWLSTYLGAENNEYTRAVGQLVLVAAVSRVRKPGSKFDELLVLESPQGQDKSTALRTLCPNDEWFSESLPLGVDSKVVIERTLGVWIVEAAEMVTEARDAERLKAFLSTQVDGPARLAYAKRPTTRARHFIVIGTTNKGEYLMDSTGNRRFWPVRCGSVDLAALKRDRDQLWAEAAHLEAHGAATRLERSLWKVAGAEQEARRVVDPWEEELGYALGDASGKVLNAELWSVLQVDAAHRTQKENARLGSVMHRLGFKPAGIKHNGNRVSRGWVRGGQPGTERPWLLKPGAAPVQQAREDQGDVPF